MDSPSSVYTTRVHHHSRGSSMSSTGAYPQQRSICICDAPPDKAYLSPLIGCANKCRPKWFHLRCVGLTQYPYDGAPWYCPSCQADQELPPQICFCDSPPYAFGPMLECAKQGDCETRWFHFPCVADTDRLHVEGEQWYCPPCTEGNVAQQEYEVEMQKQMDAVMMETYADLDMPALDVSMPQPDGLSNDLPEVVNEIALQEQDPQATLSNEASVVQTIELAPFEIPTPEPSTRAQSVPEIAKINLPGVNTPPVSRQPTPQLSPLHEEHQSVIADLRANAEPRSTTNEEAPPGLTPKEPPPDQEASNNEETSPVHEDPTQGFCLPNCGGDDHGPMIACDDAACPHQWYHYACVNVTSKPRSGKTWYCPTCLPQHPNSPNSGRKPRPSRAKRAETTTASSPQQTQPPQIAGEKRTRRTVELEYCTCGMPATDEMIACDGNCARQWFHFSCCGLTADTVPEGAWYCAECTLDEERRKKRRVRKRR